MKPNIVINVCFLGHSFTEMLFSLLAFKGQHQCNFKYQVTKGLPQFFPITIVTYLLQVLEATENHKKKKGKNISLPKRIINILMNSFPDLVLKNKKEFQNNNFFSSTIHPHLKNLTKYFNE